MTEKVKTVIGSVFLLPDFKSRGHPSFRWLQGLELGCPQNEKGDGCPKAGFFKKFSKTMVCDQF